MHTHTHKHRHTHTYTHTQTHTHTPAACAASESRTNADNPNTEACVGSAEALHPGAKFSVVVGGLDAGVVSVAAVIAWGLVMRGSGVFAVALWMAVVVV